MTTPTPRTFQRVADLLNGQGARKHADAWMHRDDRIDMSHHDIHQVRYFDEDWPDHDAESGELHIIHAIARMMLVAERRLMRDG